MENLNIDIFQRTYLKGKLGREWFTKKVIIAVPEKENFQRYHTPYDFCEKMISMTNVQDKTILILFNVEFLELLINKHNVDPENISFICDCNEEQQIAKKIYKVCNTVVCSAERWNRIIAEEKKIKGRVK